MNLTQILKPSCVKIPLENTDKQKVITELTDLLNENGLLNDRDNALEAVLMRENTRSTGIGSGLAIPHGKCSAVKELVMAIGLAKNNIDFDSIDNKPVKTVFLLVSPLDKTGPHIQALAAISRLMLNEDFKQKFEASQSAEELYDLIRKNQSE